MKRLIEKSHSLWFSITALFSLQLWYNCKQKVIQQNTSFLLLFTSAISLFATGYAGSPRNVAYEYYSKSRSYALYWEQPSTKDGHWVRKYILEEWKADKKMWVKSHNITTLHVTIKNIQSTKKYRICSANEIGYKETSCSMPIQLCKSIINFFLKFASTHEPGVIQVQMMDV